MYRSADRGASWAPISARKPAAPPTKRRSASRAPVRGTVARGRGAANTRSGAAQSGLASQKPAAAKPSDDVVRHAQEALERAGYEIGTPDGQLGPRTVAAVKRFQTDRYLTVSGQLDEATLAALIVDAGASMTSGAAPGASISRPYKHGG